MPSFNVPDPAASIAGMAAIGNPRVPMGNSAYTFNNVSGAPSDKTMMIPSKESKTGYPLGTKANRTNVPYPLPAGMGDRNGAAYRITMSTPPMTSPEAGATQANGRIIKSAVNRSLPEFQDEASYLQF